MRPPVHAFHASHTLHTLLAVAAAAGLVSAPARAEIVDIAWASDGTFEHRFEVKPGQFAEVCGKLDKGQAVRWRFESPQALHFNIHYHVGKDVVYPVQQAGTAKSEGRLAVALDQDYCWMWSNKSTQPATLQVRLAR